MCPAGSAHHAPIRVETPPFDLQEDHELGGEDGRAEFSLLLTRPAGSGSSSGGAAALAQQLQQQAL